MSEKKTKEERKNSEPVVVQVRAYPDGHWDWSISNKQMPFEELLSLLRGVVDEVLYQKFIFQMKQQASSEMQQRSRMEQEMSKIKI